jgi:allantoin racemase
MRILVLNANTTEFVTETAAAEARRVASPGTEIVPVTADFGAAIVATRTEHAIAEHAAVMLAARHAPGCDAVVIAVSYDTGLKAVREMLAIPVVGMTEAALLTACMLGGRIGLVSFGRRVWPIYRELIDGYGLSGRIAGSRVLESTSAYRPGDTSELDALVAATAVELIEKDGAESIVVLGAVMAGTAHRNEDRVAVPVLDGMRCAIPQAELLVRMGTRKPTTGSYAPPGDRATRGLDPALAALLEKRSGADQG